ncbi:phenylalanine ammonia-lyase [Auriscalpium vulgare]|uniref:Phenylalanine ammonia-lyase n=1 Tax=Auriscalpium vulgare TaxID=40419 RepID=A0ACB8RHA6_9AGAM|nr:phenylalanine ammonia-lyase [Auriscalpium vulgare]
MTVTKVHAPEKRSASTDLAPRFVQQYRELQSYKDGKTIVVDGHSLTIPAVIAASRYGASVTLDESFETRERVEKSRKVIVDAVESAKSIYGVSTGFGGSADTRTSNTVALGHALLQHHHTGILPSAPSVTSVLPLNDPFGTTSMPESWVRGAILIRINSLIRGHSAVRWELLEKMSDLLRENITPFIPLRGSISASGDLTPLSYIAGTVVGNPSIRVYDGPAGVGRREIVSSRDALKKHGLTPISLLAKEHLGIMNGTAFSASVAALVLNDAVHIGLLGQVCTAMGTEALLGVRGNYNAFIHEIARPHPGQVEAARTIWDLLEDSPLAQDGHEKEVTIDQDQGMLRQDRYPLRTAPQFLGPQIEDIVAALNTVAIECNSTTDNPLIDGETGQVHHGGNFQAMAVSNAMEKTRLALHHIGKLLFAQSTELVNPAMNRGLPPSLAATDPSLDFHAKGLDIAAAAYVSELGFLANPVSTHIQSAEMHNQAVNSLALISARATITSLEVLSMLTATYLYLLCQAFDIRAMQADFETGLAAIVREELHTHFTEHLDSAGVPLSREILTAMLAVLDSTTTMDAVPRMAKVAAAADSVFVNNLVGGNADFSSLIGLAPFRDAVAVRAAALLISLREEYLSGARGAAPASLYLNKTRPVYEFVRVVLGIRMHGVENHGVFENGLGVDDQTIGQNVSLIYEAIRDGQLQGTVVGLFA